MQKPPKSKGKSSKNPSPNKPPREKAEASVSTESPATRSSQPGCTFIGENHCENEKFLQTIIDTEPECVKMIAADGTLLMMNAAGLAMIDADSLDQIKGKPACLLVAPEFRPSFTDLIDAVFRGESRTLLFEMIGLKGRRLWLETHCVPLRDEKNEITAALGITRDITERKKMEEQLRESESSLQEAQRLAGLGSWDWNLRTGELRWSPETYRILGLSPETAAPTYETFQNAIHPDDRDRVSGAIEDALQRGNPYSIEHRIVRANGSLRMVHCRGEATFDQTGRPIRMFGTAQDITDRKRAEEALRKSEQRYRTLLESVTSYIYTVKVENGSPVSTAHGPGCVAVTGYTPEEYAVDPRLWYRMVHDEDKAMVVEQTARMLSGGQSVPLEHRLVHKNGAIRWIRNTQVPRYDEHGRLIAYDGLITDITERKSAEEFVKNILQTVDEGFIVIDREYKIISANKAYCAQVGIPAIDVIGRHCYEISHRIFTPCYDQGEECAVRKAFETGEPHAAIHSHRDRKGDPVYVETKAFPLRDESGSVTAAIEIINNITEKKRLQDQLRHAQKMEAVGLLAGGVAHDFNNILTAIVGYGNLLKMKMSPDEPLLNYVEQILASSARAANLTQSLLAFGRKQIINPKPIDINVTIARIEKLLHRVIGEDIDLTTTLAPGELTIFADSNQIEQALMNLATNARDAMPEGGILTIRTGPAVIDEAFRRVHGFGKDGRYACVSVIDTGTGMDETVRERIFEPFFTTKELGRGTGLGLAIVYGIMKQNNGCIAVESEPARGSTFTLYFPLIASAVEAPGPAEQAPPRRGDETILVAEDDRTIREITRTILGEFGYTVIEAMDGEEAVRKFRQNKAAIKLVVLDVIMPKKNGKEAYDEIVAMRPDVRTLFISGYSADVVRKKGITGEGVNLIQKPVSPMDLLAAVRKILDS